MPLTRLRQRKKTASLPKIKVEGELDVNKKAEKKIQDLTDRFVKEIDKMAEKKQKEVMSI